MLGVSALGEAIPFPKLRWSLSSQARGLEPDAIDPKNKGNMVILGLYWHKGESNGNHYLGLSI